MQSTIAHAAERKTFEIAINQVMRSIAGSNRDKAIGRLIDLVEPLLEDTSYLQHSYFWPRTSTSQK